MFPDLDRDIIDDVVRQKQGRYASSKSWYIAQAHDCN